MKKLISILVTAALAVTSVFALAGCNSAVGEESNSNGDNGTVASQDDGDDPVTPVDSDSDFKVGAIYINSQNDTSGYTYAHHKGITTWQSWMCRCR